MTELVLIRHGQASVGAADYDKLSAIGIAQSRRLGEWMLETRRSPDAVIVGGRVRQRETAMATLAAMGRDIEIVVDRAFDEFDHREILLAHEPAFADPAALKAALTRMGEFRIIFAAAIARWMGGTEQDYSESWNDFRARVADGIARHGGSGLDQVWVFTSAGPISASVAHAVGMPPARISELTGTVMNGSITRLLCQAGEIRLASFNATPHLDRADPSLSTAL